MKRQELVRRTAENDDANDFDYYGGGIDPSTVSEQKMNLDESTDDENKDTSAEVEIKSGEGEFSEVEYKSSEVISDSSVSGLLKTLIFFRLF